MTFDIVGAVVGFCIVLGTGVGYKIRFKGLLTFIIARFMACLSLKLAQTTGQFLSQLKPSSYGVFV